MEINKVIVAGKLQKEFEYDHTAYGERFYKNIISTRRKSGTYDEVPILIAEKLVTAKEDYQNASALIYGDLRSYNLLDTKGKHLIVKAFVKELCLSEKDIQENEVIITGYIGKKPVYRETPKGKFITDIFLIVPRTEKRTSCIPCICWGDTAHCASMLGVGSKLRVYGRIQSRQYVKKIPDENMKVMTTYEVSIRKMEAINENSNS